MTMHENTGVIIRATIDQVEAHRNRAIALYGDAFDKLEEARAASAAACQKQTFAAPGATVEAFAGYSKRLEERRAVYLESCRRDVDSAVWRFLIDASGLERLMDKQARDEFRASLDNDPPPATADNCRATMELLMGDAGMIFQRGISNVFSKLDRRFRSHDGFKIGSRVVLSYAFNDYGGWGRGQDETLRDIERTFYTLDGKVQPDRSAGIIGAIDTARHSGRALTRGAWDVESDYFRFKTFKNGNAHLWFKRDDLLERVNQLLVDYYGAALCASSDAADVHYAPRDRAPAKNFAFFPTPGPVLSRLMEAAAVYTPETYSGNYPRKSVLEPSAGTGAIAGPVRDAGHKVRCVELQPVMVGQLRGQGLDVVEGDFLHMTVQRLGQFDAVVMNPPFDNGRDVEHVTHALQFVAPGGTLAAVMAAGVEFREDHRTTAFRALVERYGGRFEDLPAGSFSSVGTNVNTVIVKIRVPS